MVAAPLLPRWALTLAAVAPLVFPCVLCGTGPEIQRPGIGATAEGGSLDCHGICDPADDADSREVKAIEFLKTLWLPGDTNATIPEANTRKYLSSFFSVSYDNATRVRDLAIKHPPPGGALVTASQMSCALRCLAHLRGLFVDNSGIAGALGDLFLPEHLVELHARECPLRGALADLNLQNPLKGLKLSGKNPRDIYGDLHDLKEFIWDRLEFLDFRGASSITGNLSALVSALDIRRLRGVFLQYTSVTGDITQLLRANKLMTWLDLRGTKAYGSINSEWLDLGQDLIYLRLSNSRVTFNMDEPAIVKDKRTAKKPFPRLARLDLNGCPLNMDIWDLLLPLMYNDKLFWLQAEGCGLRGAIQDMRSHRLFPTYFGLYILDLSGNNITELAGRPLGDCSYDLEGNPLARISEMYFAWPSSLNIRQSSFDSEVKGSIWGVDGPRQWEDVFEVSDQSVSSVQRNMGEGWECLGLRSKENHFFDLMVSPDTFAPWHLCHCLTGYQGEGTNCTICPGGVTSIPVKGSRSRCCACPEGKTRIGDMCYQCMGPGCTEQVCAGACPRGYEGRLCSMCGNNHQRKIGSNVCVECTHGRWSGGWTYLKYLVVGSLWIGGLGTVLWYFVYHRVERFSAFELGLRKQECIEQSLLLLTFFQLLKTLRSAVDESSDSSEGGTMSRLSFGFHLLHKAVLLRIGDLLKLLGVECDFGHSSGLLVQRLSTAFLMPSLCFLALAVGGYRGSPFFALKFCILVLSLLFPGTIEVTLSNLICVTADEDGLPLPSQSTFLKELPWAHCDSQRGFLHVLLWVAFVLNAVLLPLSILILARYIHREVQPLWLWSRWLRPSDLASCSRGFMLRWDLPPATSGGPAPGSSYTLMLQKSSQIFLAAHAACLSQALGSPETLAIKTSLLKGAAPGWEPEKGQALNLVVDCRSPAGWTGSPEECEAALRNARRKATALGEMLLYREASQRALKALGAKPLWIGARPSFEKFSTTDPLLFVGIQKLVVFAITGLCVRKDLASVAASFLLLSIGIWRGLPYGTSSRNELGFICSFFLTGYSLLLFLFPDGALKPLVQAAVVAGPICYYLHLQLAPADLTIETYSLLARLKALDPDKEPPPEPPSIPDCQEQEISVLPRPAFSWEEHWSVRWLFHGYRLRVRPFLAQHGAHLHQIEAQSLHGVGSMVRLLAGRGTVSRDTRSLELASRISALGS